MNFYIFALYSWLHYSVFLLRPNFALLFAVVIGDFQREILSISWMRLHAVRPAHHQFMYLFDCIWFVCDNVKIYKNSISALKLLRSHSIDKTNTFSFSFAVLCTSTFHIFVVVAECIIVWRIVSPNSCHRSAFESQSFSHLRFFVVDVAF